MTILGTMLSAFLITSGILLGALAFGGHFAPPSGPDQSALARVSGPADQPGQIKPAPAKTRFVASEGDVAKAPQRAKVAASKPALKKRQEPRDGRPRQASAEWRSGLFGN
jgi:hypothetical protein